MSNTEIAYQFDKDGYFLAETLVQKVGDDYLIPPDTTMTKPTFKAGYWTKWNGKKWTNEKIPTTCAEAISKGLTCIPNGQGKHNYEVKTLLEALVAAESDDYRIKFTEDFVMSIEEIPEPTEKEKQIEKDKQEQQEAAAYLNELKELAQSAQLMGDSEWYAEIQAEYQSIVNGE